MTTPNEPLHSIQARIEELQNTITEKEEQIKTRARNLKDELQDELEAQFSPEVLVKKYPFQAAGAAFVTGLVVAKLLKGRRGSSSPTTVKESWKQERTPSPEKSALYTIGLEVLRSAKELGFTYLQRYIDKKIK